MADEAPPTPHTGIQQIDGKMFQLFALVVEALAAATDALLSGDKHVAAVLAGRDELVDDAYNDVGRLVNRAVALEAPRGEGPAVPAGGLTRGTGAGT